MKLYLSSFRIGNRPEELLKLLKGRKRTLAYLILGLLLSLSFGVLFLEKSYQSCKVAFAEKFVNRALSVNCDELINKARLKDASSLHPYPGNSSVYELDRGLIGGNNGMTCVSSEDASIKFAFVAADLPKLAKEYVAYHEDLHTKTNYSEARVNYLAGINKPLGLAETVIYSVQKTFQANGLNKCSWASLWKVFKVYFLNDNFKDLIDTYMERFK